MTELDFQQQVLDKSFKIPVVVDFWAPWCSPCKYMNPALENLSALSSGKWSLYKINIEEEEELARQLRVRSIPSLKLFHKGKEIASLNGAVPQYELQRWLDKNLPDEVQEEWERLKKELIPEELFFPNYRIQTFVSHYRNFEEGILYLALSKVITDPQFTGTVLARLHPKAEHLNLREDIQALYEFFTLPESEERPAQILNSSAQCFSKRRFQEGFDLLIQAVILDKSFAHDLPRRVSIAIFRILGDDHSLTRAYRKRFDMALY